MRLVIDASVAVKWAVAEDDHDLAIALIGSKHESIAPDFLLLEVSNVLWKKVRRKETAPNRHVRDLRGHEFYSTRLSRANPIFLAL